MYNYAAPVGFDKVHKSRRKNVVVCSVEITAIQIIKTRNS